MSYAIGVNEFEGIWRVYCNVCRCDMGTMSITTLKAALSFAVEKGGVMCPECRGERCIKCGVVPRGHALEAGVCAFCIWDESEEESGLAQAVQACLVNQNSRNPREPE